MPLDKGLIRQLSTGRFIEDKRGILVVGATGTGKTYLACAFGQQACRLGFRVRYYRTSRLLHELQLARLDGSYARLLGRLARIEVLILDDFLMSPPTEAQRRDLLEVLEDRYGLRSTITTSVHLAIRASASSRARWPAPTTAQSPSSPKCSAKRCGWSWRSLSMAS